MRMRPADLNILKAVANDIAFNVKALRLKQKRTQFDLAYEAEVDLLTLHRIEKGNGATTLKTLAKLAASLDVEVRDLLRSHK